MNTPMIPCHIETEIALIGCVFLDENVITEIGDILSPEDFYDTKNRLIYAAMLNLYNNGQSIDPTTVIAKLQERNQLEQCGGLEYISKIADYQYSTSSVDSYVETIESDSLKRNTIKTLQDLAQKGYDSNVSAFDYIEHVEHDVFDLSKRRRVDEFKKVSKVAADVLVATEKRASMDDEIIGLDTGFGCLNKISQGFQPGALLILAARPAMGKSAFSMNVAVNVAQRNKRGNASVAIFSLEMSAEQLVERMLACDSSIKLGQIKNGRIPEKDWIRFTTSCTKLGQLHLHFDDESNSTIASIRAKCRKLKASEEGLDFVVIDYLQLIEGDSDRDSEQAKITKITRSLKLMARELEIPVLALSQLSRDVEKREGDKKPIMADLRSSGSIEQDADMVMFLYREDYYNHASERKGEADLIIAKNRSGNTSEGLPFIFTGEFQRFKEKKDEE